VNRLKCLQELIKYKDLFYDENFNQETVKNYARVNRIFLIIKFSTRRKYFKIKQKKEIYSKYIAVSARNSIDCGKPDRLKIHYLFIDSNQSHNINYMNSNSTFRPTYEGKSLCF